NDAVDSIGERSRPGCSSARPRAEPPARGHPQIVGLNSAPEWVARARPTAPEGHGDKTWVTEEGQDMGYTFGVCLRHFCGHAVENTFVAQSPPAPNPSGAGTSSTAPISVPPFRS